MEPTYDDGGYRPVVCDNGTGFTKAGFAGSNFPKVVIPAMVGRPLLRYEEDQSTIQGIHIKDIMCGQDVADLRNMLEINYPVENGIIRDWDDMYHLWDHTFKELEIDPSNHKILLTEPPLNPKKNRVRMMETMFEKYGFTHGKCTVQAILVLYAQGLLTGVVVDSGDGVSHIVPVYEGMCPEHLIRRLDVAGRHVTRYLIKILQLRGYNLNRTADFETARQIKEKLCYVGYDFAVENRLARETTVLVQPYTLPDGRIIKLGRERFQAPEVLFSPGFLDIESPGVSEMLFNCINDADMDLRSEFYKHVVLSGGSSMYPGLPSRMEKDMRDLFLERVLKGDSTTLHKFKIRIEDPPRRKHMVYLGGAVLADIMKDQAEEFWISRQEFDEHGESILSKK